MSFGGGTGTVSTGMRDRAGRLVNGTSSSSSAKTTPPAITDPGVQEAAQAAREAAAQAYGRGSTILTSALGDLAPAVLGKKTLLGA